MARADGIERRLRRLEAQWTPRTREDPVWVPWGEAMERWPTVPAAERQRLLHLFQRMGGTRQPILVHRPDGRWTVSPINTPYGRAAYLIRQTLRTWGADTVADWLARQATDVELDALGRLLDAAWDPDALHDGDARTLESLAERLIARPPASPAPASRARERGTSGPAPPEV